MKKSILAFSIIFASVFSTGAFAKSGDVYDLKALDKFGSCKLGTVQEVNAELALSFLKAFVTWHIGDQIAAIHPDYIAWHSSIAGLLEAKPAYRGKIPPDMGQYTKANYIETMTFLAYHNDIEKYEVVPTRVDCVGDDRVILITDFTGFQLQRDPATGCVTHKAPFGSPTKIAIQFKDYQKSPQDPVQRLAYRTESYLDDTVSAKVRDDLAKIVATQPALKPEPSTCKTSKMIFDEFSAQVVP